MKLRAVLADPNEATWEEAYRVIIRPATTTLWKAVRNVDPTFPATRGWQDGWVRIPDQMLIARALRTALRHDGDPTSSMPAR